VGKTINIKILGLALFAAFAFSAVAAASAFAVSEWLFNGSPIGAGTELLTDTEGELTLLVLSGATLVNEIKCSGLFEGDVGSAGLTLVLDLFSLLPTNTLIQELSGTSLDCATVFNVGSACPVGGETLVWVDELSLTLGLTWEALIELMAVAPEFLLHFENVAFELLCVIGGTNAENLCGGLTSGKLENSGTNVLLELGTAAPISSELLTCGGGETAGIDGDLVIKHGTSGTLAVS
jgi:hypothetical protein